MEYYNCDENPWVAALASQLATERTEAAARHRETEVDCLRWRDQHSSDHDVPHVQVVGRHWTNASCRSVCEDKCRWTEAHVNFGPLHQHHYACCKRQRDTRCSINH